MPGELLTLCSRRTLRGTVALADALGVAIARLSLGPDGLHVERFVDLGDAELPPEYASGDPAAVAAALRDVMHKHDLGRRLTCLGVDDSLTGASLADLPLAKGRALSALVGRHVREELPTQDAPVLADLLRVAPRHDGDPKTRCWVAWAEQPLMSGLNSELRRAGLRVDRVLPPSVALLDMLGRAATPEHDRIELVVRFCWPSVVIGVYAGGSPQYARFLGDLLVDAVGDPVDAGITELQRTVAFVRERNRGRAPDVVWHTGLDPSRARDFEQRVEAGMGISAAHVRLSAEGEVDSGRSDRLTVLAALLHHGAERGRGKDQSLDLLPDPPPRDHWVLAGMGAALMLTASISFADFAETDQGNLSVGAHRAALAAEQERLRSDEDGRARLRDELALREAWAGSLAVVPDAQHDPVRPVLDALMALPDGVALDGVDLRNEYDGEGALQLSLSGDFTGGGADDLAAYLARLERRPWAQDLSAERGSLAFARRGDAVTEELRVELRLQ